ncbi:MAG TPA: hypothetical protein VNB59_02265 [Solirubrobacterales bacterium]|jgi:hypothetical protein|nr:hypothetical protein [Solirubrobacterales bacterium]
MSQDDPSQAEPEHEPEQLAEEEAEAAAAEADEIGGAVPPDTDDPAEQPLIEGGGGEAEGFELAEKRLEDVAGHGDQHRFPGRDALPPEEPTESESGEPDQAIPDDE